MVVGQQNNSAAGPLHRCFTSSRLTARRPVRLAPPEPRKLWFAAFAWMNRPTASPRSPRWFTRAIAVEP